METIDDGGPAFPFKCQGTTTGPETYYGMSLRDYFAAQAIPDAIDYRPASWWSRIRAFCGYSYTGASVVPDAVAKNAYAIADAMLAARKANP